MKFIKNKIQLIIWLNILMVWSSFGQVGQSLEKLGLFAKDSIISNSVINVSGQAHASMGIFSTINQEVDSIYLINDSIASLELSTLYFDLKNNVFDTIVLNNEDSLTNGHYYISASTLPQYLRLKGDSNSVFVFYFPNDLEIPQFCNVNIDNVKKSNIYWVVDGNLLMQQSNVGGVFISSQNIITNNVNSAYPSIFSFHNILCMNDFAEPNFMCIRNMISEYSESHISNVCSSTITSCEYVFNNSFEDFTFAPTQWSQLDRACNWYQPNTSTPELFSIFAPLYNNSVTSLCVSVPKNGFGSQVPHSGNGYAGIVAYYDPTYNPNYKEYLQQRLAQPLIAGNNYYLSFWVSLAEMSYWKIQNIGAYVSQIAPSNFYGQTLNFIPQVESNGGFLSDCTNYIKIEGCFSAVGGEEFITIGNFRSNSNTPLSLNFTAPCCTTCVSPGIGYRHCSYYYVDDVTLREIPHSENLFYTTNCGIPIQIGPTPSMCALADYHGWVWSPSTGLSPTNVQNPTFMLTSPGVYHYQATWNSSLFGCPVVYNITITIPGTPASIISNGTTLGCSPATKTLTAIPAGGFYDWLNVSTGMSLGHTQNITITQPGIYEVTITQNGCVSTASVTITENPPITISINNPTPIACNLQQVTLSTNCPTCVSYSWAPTGETTSQINVVAGNGVNNYTVTGTDAYGCTATANTSINVLNVPPPIIAGPTSHCKNDVVVLTISNYISSYDQYYQWSVVSSGLGSVIISYPTGNNQTIEIVFETDLGGVVTLTYGLPGCMHTVIYYIQDCCYEISGQDPMHDQSTPNNLTPFPIDVASNLNSIVFNGTFIIDRNYTFDNCNPLSFAPGAKMLVKAGITLTINQCTLQPGVRCCSMWKGIELEVGANIVFTNSTIAQSEYAITARNNCSYKLIHADFIDNYVGLNLKSEFGIAGISGTMEYVNFYANQYYCSGSATTGNFVQPYPGQTTVIGVRPLSGIMAKSVNVVNVGNSLNTPGGNIHFNNLCNGIISDNVSFLNIRNSSFVDMIGDFAYNPLLGIYKGCGLRMTKGNLNFEGLGGQFGTSPFSMKNCFIGAYLSGVSGGVYNNSTDFDVRTCLWITRCPKLSILNNSFSASIYGIHTYQNPDNSQIRIHNNEFRLPVSGSTTGVNILLEEGLATHFDIRDNHIFVNKGRAGIQSLNGNNSVVENNWIEITTASTYSGIDFHQGTKNHIKCNTVTSIPGVLNQFQNGIWLFMSTNAEVGGNYVDQENIGFRFSGTCSNTVFELNKMNYHIKGLVLDYNALIGQQYNASNNYGNLWQVPCGLFDAFLTSPLSLFTNRFEYDFNGVSQNHPDPSRVNVVNWFNANFIPDLDISTYSCAPYIPPTVEAQPEDYLVASGAIVPDSIYPEQNYGSMRYLFEKLKQNPDLLQGDPILTSFYNQEFLGQVGQFGSVAVDIKNALKWQTVYYAVFEANLNMIQQKSDSIKITLERLEANPQDQSLIEQFNDLSNALIDLKESNDNIFTVTSQFQELEIQNLISANESLIDGEVYESNERTVNTIYLNTIARDIFELNEDQITALEPIIYQCPFSGGQAVILARILYSMVNDIVQYNDDDLCIFQGIAPRLKKDELYSYSLLFPNPANPETTLKYHLGLNQVGIFQLVDNLGRVIYNKNLLNSENELVIDCSLFHPGVYYYKVLVDEIERNGGLFSIVK